MTLTGCAGLAQSLPHARFGLGGFGVELSVDTRTASDMVAGLVIGGTAGVAGAAAVAPQPTTK